MKKLFVTMLFIVFVLILVLSACTSVLDDVESYVSYLEKDLLVASVDGYSVEWIVGQQSTLPFSQIKVFPLTTNGLKEEAKLVIDGNEIVLNKSTTRYAYETSLTTDVVPSNVELYIGNVCFPITLTSIREEGLVDYVTALKASTTEFFDKLNEDYENGFSYSIKIKLVPDRLGEKPYYYYISYEKSDSKLATLVDPTTGLVVAKRG